MSDNLDKRRLFVVDDDEQILELYALVLRDAGFEVETFGDGLTAVQRAAVCGPDLVLTDFSMPKLNGIGLAKWLGDHRPNCRVVLISGQAMQLGEYAAGCPQVTLLQKPVSPAQIVLIVQRALTLRTQSEKLD